MQVNNRRRGSHASKLVLLGAALFSSCPVLSCPLLSRLGSSCLSSRRAAAMLRGAALPLTCPPADVSNRVTVVSWREHRASRAASFVQWVLSGGTIYSRRTVVVWRAHAG